VNAVALAVLLFSAVAFATPVAACGWGGEDDCDEDIPVVEVGPDGKPIADGQADATDPTGDAVAASRLDDRYRTGPGVNGGAKLVQRAEQK